MTKTQPSVPSLHQPKFLWNPTRTELVTTRFMRNRILFSTLAGDLLPRLRKQKNGPLKLLFWGCSIGCEPYTHKYLLGRQSTAENKGIDQDARAIHQARLGIAHHDTWTVYFDGHKSLMTMVSGNKELFVPASNGSANSFQVAADYRRNVSFLTGDLFSAEPAVPENSFDLVVCNNLLLHLEPRSASVAWDYLYRYLNADGLLVIGGCNPSVRLESARRLNLVPCPERLVEISKKLVRRIRSMEFQSRPLPGLILNRTRITLTINT